MFPACFNARQPPATKMARRLEPATLSVCKHTVGMLTFKLCPDRHDKSGVPLNFEQIHHVNCNSFAIIFICFAFIAHDLCPAIPGGARALDVCHRAITAEIPGNPPFWAFRGIPVFAAPLLPHAWKDGPSPEAHSHHFWQHD